MENNKNIERYEELMAKVERPGKEALMDYIRKSDFYTAPASTKYHLSVPGGLLQHSLNVYDCLQRKKDNQLWAGILLGIGEDAMILCPLLHDICKTYFYTTEYKNQKSYDPAKVAAASASQVKRDNGGSFIWEQVQVYTIDDKVPYGHGEKSVMMIEQFMRLASVERYAIRWHMGYSEPPQLYLQLGQAIEKYPFILALHEADMEASNLIEDTTGNKVLESAESGEPDFQDAEPLEQ